MTIIITVIEGEGSNLYLVINYSKTNYVNNALMFLHVQFSVTYFLPPQTEPTF